MPQRPSATSSRKEQAKRRQNGEWNFISLITISCTAIWCADTALRCDTSLSSITIDRRKCKVFRATKNVGMQCVDASIPVDGHARKYALLPNQRPHVEHSAARKFRTQHRHGENKQHSGKRRTVCRVFTRKPTGMLTV